MAKTKGGQVVGSRRSRRNQGLEATPATNLKVNKAIPKKRPGRKKTVVADDVEDITPKPTQGVDDDMAEDAMSEDEDEVREKAAGGNQEQQETNHEATEQAVSEQQGTHHKAPETEVSEKQAEEENTEKEAEEENTEKEAEEENNEKEAEEENNDQDVNMEPDGGSNGNNDEVVNEKKRRGPTKMRKVAENPQEKVEVTFTEGGDHVGPGSVTLSSFLGPLVREHVPVTLSDWRKLDAVTKETMWEEIQGRFNVHEEWQKVVILKQLGSLWRAGKSRLVTEVRAAKTAAERTALKPSNIPSIQVWNSWVKSKCSTSFKLMSDKYRELRRNQIPHTTSRKGMLRLAYDMKKKSNDPSKVTRSKVWIAGHTHGDGRPVKPQFAETIEQIQSMDSQMDSTSASENIREDAVSKVLGKDKPGRVRGFGRGITATKLAFLHSRDAKIAEMESEIKQLKGMVQDLAEKKKSNGDPETSASSGGLKEGVLVKIMDWFDPGEVVVGVGVLCSCEPQYKIGGVSIGPNAVAILVKAAYAPESSLWRPTIDMSSLQETVGCKIAWPIDKVMLDENSSPDVSMQTGGHDTRRCKIFDWTNEDEEVIAEGIICSSNSKEMVNNIPLGPNAVSIEVVKVFKIDAYLWRPAAEFTKIGDAIHEKIAWPVLKIEIMSAADSTPTKTVEPKSSSPGSNSSTQSAKKKCILLDCNNSGRKVAEGRVASTDPNDMCHHKPLGPNASKVWVEVAKIGDAHVWRPNSEIAIIADAIGTPVAWPNDKIVYI